MVGTEVVAAFLKLTDVISVAAAPARSEKHSQASQLHIWPHSVDQDDVQQSALCHELQANWGHAETPTVVHCPPLQPHLSLLTKTWP